MDLAGLVPASRTGHVLVTSQASRWPAPTIPIEVLDEGSAVDLLTGMSGARTWALPGSWPASGHMLLALALAASCVATQPDLRPTGTRHGRCAT